MTVVVNRSATYIHSIHTYSYRWIVDIYLCMNVSIMEVPDIVERAAEELVLGLADSNTITIPRGWYVEMCIQYAYTRDRYM